LGWEGEWQIGIISIGGVVGGGSRFAVPHFPSGMQLREIEIVNESQTK
jgi:hypothetical protein